MMIAPLRAVRHALTTHHRRAELPVRDPYAGAQELARRHQAVRAELDRIKADRLAGEQGRIRP